MGKFSDDVAAWVKNTQAKADEAVRAVAIGVLRSVVLKSPVGNPELWAVNAHAAQYNTEVANHNAALRLDPANLNKAGRLRKGIKLNDGMDIKAPAGYVGGRFRGNWQVTLGSPAEGSVDSVDPGGGETIAAGSDALTGFKAGQPIFLTNNLPYGPRIEYESWSKQAPAGVVRVTVAEFQLIVNEQVSALK